ncbi:hypothetical protein [Halostagnicola kamekurae]|uniref:SPW repeat-containing protein n=1 Tax=Halostagnicola kamekurae TaxID=619731 RepID=A0A1I6P726_9EURY|nr:hypothetical protein [Halostagnicola kamekurae]SFS35981.1 hypothetical protein SAMN04488556_0365 [Halostagnicola kamekurae]
MNVQSRAGSSAEVSTGIKLLAGVMGLCACALAGFGFVAAIVPAPGEGTGPTLFVTALVLGMGVGMLVLAAGLWLGTSWAWTCGCILYAGSAFGGLSTGIRSAGLPVLAGGIVSGLIAAYLYREREQFGIEFGQ